MMRYLFLFIAFHCTLAVPGLCIEPAIMPEQRSSLESMARNYTYRLLVPARTITLRDGKFKGGEQPDDALEASLADFLISDLDEDGTPDIAVVIEHHGMGSSAFYELSALVNRGGQYRQTNPVLLGDNVRIREIGVVAPSMWSPKELTVSMLVHKDQDSHADPTLEVQQSYFLDGEQLKNFDDVPIVKKPAIYLYPVQTSRVVVTLKPKGRIIQSIPHYDRRWEVTAERNGLIDSTYRYLFYEVALDDSLALPDTGWSVSHDQLGRWFDGHLQRFGLNREEARDFRDYWLASLPSRGYYTIRLADMETLDRQLGLDVAPRPDNILRLLMHFEPTVGKVDIREPVIKKFERKGFVVVEWGGILGSGASTKNVR